MTEMIDPRIITMKGHADALRAIVEGTSGETKARAQVRLDEAEKHLADLRAEVSPSVHKAAPGARSGYCEFCGQRIRRVPGGQGPTWVHADSGAVAAPNKRVGKC